jgi:hypothetical protein
MRIQRQNRIFASPNTQGTVKEAEERISMAAEPSVKYGG